MPFADDERRKQYIREYQKKWKKALVDRWRAAKACIHCGLPVSQYVSCRSCRAGHQASYQRLMARRPPIPCITPGCGNHTRRSRTGLCQFCARSKAGRTRCLKAARRPDGTLLKRQEAA